MNDGKRKALQDGIRLTPHRRLTLSTKTNPLEFNMSKSSRDSESDRRRLAADIEFYLMKGMVRNVLTSEDPEDAKSPDFEERVACLAQQILKKHGL